MVVLVNLARSLVVLLTVVGVLNGWSNAAKLEGVAFDRAYHTRKSNFLEAIVNEGPDTLCQRFAIRACDSNSAICNCSQLVSPFVAIYQALGQKDRCFCDPAATFHFS
ncbi:hypothetical protein KCU61_g404, partial [Aureobasidium melanogenum]